MALDQPFRLRLSGDHRPIQCCWRRETLERGSQTFREVNQLTMTIWGEQTDHLQDLESLLAANDVHILALSTGTEMGSQLLQFVVFGQTKQRGPPIILLQGVQQVLRRRGLGTWALQFLYRECARSRELLAKGYLRTGYMDFLTAKGFVLRGGSVKLASVDDRYPTVGAYICRRPQRQGEFMGPSLGSVVATYNVSNSRAAGTWTCPPQVGFTQPIGRNSCFAHALIQLILGVPQLAAFFATQDWQADDTGALLNRCLALLWLREDDQEGPEAVELLRARVIGEFGQNHHQLQGRDRGRGGYAGQQDPAEFWSAIFKELTGDRMLESGDGEGGTRPVEPLSPLEGLVVTQSICVRSCSTCKSETRRLETLTAWRLPARSNDVRTVHELCEPMLSDSCTGATPSPGCVARGCKGDLTLSRAYPVVLPPVLRMEFSAGEYDDARGISVRKQGRIDLPLTLVTRPAQRGSQTVTYYLRMLLFNSGGKTTDAGHFISGRLRGLELETCSQLPGGVRFGTHTISHAEYLKFPELKPPLSSRLLLVAAWYSVLMEGETREAATREDSPRTHFLTDFPLRPALSELPRWYVLGAEDGLQHPIFHHSLWASEEEDLTRRLQEPRGSTESAPGGGLAPVRRSSRARPPVTLEDTLAELDKLVPRSEVHRGGAIDWYEERYAEAMTMTILCSEVYSIPYFFWMPSTTTTGLGFEDAMQQDTALTLHRQSVATTGRGGRMSLQEALDYSRRHREPLDPLVSVEAMPTGLYGLPGGRAYREELRRDLGLEVTGGAGVLVSGAGVETKFHLHDMPVLNMVWAVAYLEPGSGKLTFSYPNREGGLQVRKRYVFFDTATLERAGIACHDVDGVQSLVSLLVRIRGLSEPARKGIRWFTEVLDGERFNAVYFSAAMLHQVTTESISAEHDKSLYIGGAMEVIPTDAHTRRIILERLSRPSPLTPHGPAVSEMRHIRGQPYTAFTMQLIKDLVAGNITSVSQRMTWFETQAMRRAVGQWVSAVQQAEQGAWEKAEQLLLEGARQLEPLSSWIPTLASQVEQCRREVSGLLLAGENERADLIGPVLSSLRSVGCYVDKT